MNKFNNSNIYRDEIHQLIPGGCHTYSKGDDQFPELSPAAISYGKGAYVWDIDHNRYLDCSMGLTSVSLGHAYPPVLDAVKIELEKGVNFQRPSCIEMEMAKKFLSLIPCHDRIKFAKNGSTITTAAIKLARAFTGRKKVAFASNHPFYSYDDWFISKKDCNLGIPDEIAKLSVTYDGRDLTTLENLFQEHHGEIACVISEPEQYMGQSDEYLNTLIDITHMHDALFIQDEMITGFKADFPGCITKYGVEPDLATWGKGIANGFSFCALTGKKEVMDLGSIKDEGLEKLFLISTTHGGETHAIAAGIATIDEFINKNVIKHNHLIGHHIIEGVIKLLGKMELADYVDIYPCPWFVVTAYKDHNLNISSSFRTLMLQEMIKNGVLFQGTFVPCFSHSSKDVEVFLDAFERSLAVYKKAINEGLDHYLVGPECKPVFRKFQ